MKIISSRLHGAFGYIMSIVMPDASAERNISDPVPEYMKKGSRMHSSH